LTNKKVKTFNGYQFVPDLIKFQKYILDKGTSCEQEVILHHFGKIFGTVSLPYSNDNNPPKSWEVMLGRLTKIESTFENN